MASKLESERAFHNKILEDQGRAHVNSFYSIAASSQRYYTESVRALGRGKSVLEYGCGTGSCAFFLGRTGAEVTGIDISDGAIERAREQARKERCGRAKFQVMNAEALTFEDRSFDLVCGSGILHHLELEKAYSELARTLKADGCAVFLEPLAHNPVINLYRRWTPGLRTPDEHPLTMADLRLAEEYFGRVEVRYFHLNTLLALPVRKLPGARWLVRGLDALDRAAFAVLPPLRRYAWAACLTFHLPKKSPGTP